MRVNNNGFINALEVARIHKTKIFAPSTIAVFGKRIDLNNVKTDSILEPLTVYGVTKVFGELLGSYYHDTHGVDFRSIRYPGIMSAEKFAFNGTTDYSTCK